MLTQGRCRVNAASRRSEYSGAATRSMAKRAESIGPGTRSGEVKRPATASKNSPFSESDGGRMMLAVFRSAANAPMIFAMRRRSMALRMAGWLNWVRVWMEFVFIIVLYFWPLAYRGWLDKGCPTWKYYFGEKRTA